MKEPEQKNIRNLLNEFEPEADQASQDFAGDPEIQAVLAQMTYEQQKWFLNPKTGDPRSPDRNSPKRMIMERGKRGMVNPVWLKRFFESTVKLKKISAKDATRHDSPHTIIRNIIKFGKEDNLTIAKAAHKYLPESGEPVEVPIEMSEEFRKMVFEKGNKFEPLKDPASIVNISSHGESRRFGKGDVLVYIEKGRYYIQLEAHGVSSLEEAELHILDLLQTYYNSNITHRGPTHAGPGTQGLLSKSLENKLKKKKA